MARRSRCAVTSAGASRLTFTLPASLATVLGTYANGSVSARVLILAFVPVMAVAAGATWHRAGETTRETIGECPRPRLGRTLVAGSGVGLLTGFSASAAAFSSSLC